MTGNRLLRQFRAHPRLLFSVALAAVAGLLLPAEWRSGTRTILALDIGALAFLALTWSMMIGATPDHMRQRATLMDEGQIVILLLTVGAAAFSLLAVATELHGLKDLQGSAIYYRVAVAAATILCSWFVTHTMFALHYAHGYYSDADPSEDKRADVGGLEFAGDCKEPDYWDFLYFSFVIGMTFQTSDTAVSSRSLRRLTLGHSVLAFFFNTVILALSINIMAGLL